MARTQVGIIGAGPAGLVLAHLLDQAGVESVVLEKHSREYVESRVRAGLIEHGTVQLLTERGLGEHMNAEGMAHHGTEIRFAGRRRRIPYTELTGGRSMLVYPQQALVADLIRLRLAVGGAIQFEAEAMSLSGLESGVGAAIDYQDNGEPARLTSDFVAGCDGFHGVARAAIPPEALTVFDNRLPFGWLGILATVPPSTDEIIYALHDHGFAGHMIRTAEVSRFYLQCDPDDDIANWPDERIWAELQTRLSTPGWTLREGPIIEKSISELRSFVVEPMSHGRLFLAGDAAHIVPPTGAKGMNLAIADAKVLAEALIAWYRAGDGRLLDAYSETCLRRVWRVQEFSSWMSWLLHRIHDDLPDAAYRQRLQRSQLEYLFASDRAAAVFAENYVG